MTKKIQVSRPVCSATVAGRVFGPLKAPKNQEGDSPNFVEILLTPALYSDPMVYNPQDRHIDTDMNV